MRRKNQIIIGILFAIATISYMLGDYIVLSHLNNQKVHLPIYIGIFLEYINSFAVISIAIGFFPFLYSKSKFIGLAYIVSRTIESILLFVATLFPLIAIQNITIGNSSSVLTFAYLQMFQIGMLSLSLGSVLFCYWLYKFSTLPKWLSILGIIGYILLLISCILSTSPALTSISDYLYIPGAIFEVVFPVYLIIKGVHMKDENIINNVID